MEAVREAAYFSDRPMAKGFCEIFLRKSLDIFEEFFYSFPT